MDLKTNKRLDESLKLIVKSSFFVLFGVIISKILIYVYRIIIARYYGPEEYGLFSLSVAIAGIFMAIFGLGLNEGLLRFIPIFRGEKKLNEMRYLFRFSLWVSFLSGVLAFILLFSFSKTLAIQVFHNTKLVFYFRVFSILIPTGILWGVYISVIRAFEFIKIHSFIFNILQNVIKVVAILIFIFLGFRTYKSISFSYILAFICMLLASYYFCKNKIMVVFGKYSIEQKSKRLLNREFILYSIPLSFAGFISIIFYWIDSLLIGYFKSPFEVGLYNAVIPIAMLLTMAPELFAQLFLPLITKYYSERKTELIKEISKQIGKWIFIINFAIFLLVLVFPGAFINVLFGKEYLVAENALRILLFGSFVSSLAFISSNLIRVIGKSHLILVDIALASILNVILNYTFIPMQKIGFIDNSYGIVGAALGTSISLIFLSLLFIYQAWHNLKFFPFRKKIINILFISLIPTIITLYIRSLIDFSGLIRIIVLSFTFLIVYLLLIVLTRSLDRNDLGILKKILDKIKNLYYKGV